MIPKSYKTKQDTSPIEDHKISFDHNPSDEVDLKTCQFCNYNFGWTKNKIVYKHYVILLQDENEYKSICSKCVSRIDDRKIKKLFTFEEFQKRNVK